MQIIGLFVVIAVLVKILTDYKSPSQRIKESDCSPSSSKSDDWHELHDKK